ncbi:MAG: hypothetical protein KGJ28_11605 [Alphaproteobacteria bacterium]|nr:hypothetical protein [Alphaproteobacteria bacterium]
MTSKIGRLAAAFLITSALAMTAAYASEPIKGWWEAGGAPQDYDFGTEHVDGAPSQKSAFIKWIGPKSNSWGTLSQATSAAPYLGKRVRLSVMIKTKDADSAQLWLQMQGPGNKMLGFYNMDDRPVKGTTDWKRYDAVLDVPKDTQEIYFGYFLKGKGEAWADNVKIEAVGDEVPVSTQYPNKYPDKPANMDFKE